MTGRRGVFARSRLGRFVFSILVLAHLISASCTRARHEQEGQNAAKGGPSMQPSKIAPQNIVQVALIDSYDPAVIESVEHELGEQRGEVQLNNGTYPLFIPALTAMCTIVERTECFADIANIGNKKTISDTWSLDQNGAYCYYTEHDEMTFGFDNGKRKQEINQQVPCASAHRLLGEMRGPIATFTFNYIYFNKDNCGCCLLGLAGLLGASSFEQIVIPGVFSKTKSF